MTTTDALLRKHVYGDCDGTRPASSGFGGLNGWNISPVGILCDWEVQGGVQRIAVPVGNGFAGRQGGASRRSRG